MNDVSGSCEGSRLTASPADAPAFSLLVPSRGRPQQLARLLDSVVKTCAAAERVEVVVYLDHDDADAYQQVVQNDQVTVLVGKRRPMSELNAACLEESRGDIVICCNDDVVIRTAGWDAAIWDAAAAYDDGVYLFYPEDLFRGRRLATFPILSRRTCALLQDPFPTAYKGSFLDVHLMDVFQRLRRLGADRVRFLPDVVFEHMHFRRGKAPLDATYRERDRFRDDLAFVALSGERQRAAARLHFAVSTNRAVQNTGTPDPPQRAPTPSPSVLVWCLRTALDPALPPMWRTYLATWFLMRIVYSRLVGRNKPGA